MKFWLLFLLLPTVAIAIAPLHPDAPSYDGLHNIDVDDYTSTRLIHPSICKGLSSQGCDTWEDEMQVVADNFEDEELEVIGGD